MHSSRVLTRAAVFAALALGNGSAEAASFRGVTGIALGHVAWVHRQPDAASPRVGFLRPTDLRVRTLACKQLAAGGWCRVAIRGDRGWVQDRYLRAAAIMRG